MTKLADQPGAHALEDRKDDLYETPPVATKALLRHVELPEVVWEPACGRGSMSNVLVDAGHIVHATDLVDYGCIDYGCFRHQSRVDFLMERRAPTHCGAIVTNPPFKLAEEFVQHAVSLAPQVCMLLRLGIIAGSRRKFPAFDDGSLARILIFKKRLPRMHRDGWDGPKSTSMVEFAWFCWQAGHKKKTTIERIDW